jgi:hypothetical protein
MKKYIIDNEIYPENIIEQAISDFKEVSEIKFVNNEIIINSEEDSDEIFNEFMNYII